MSTSTSARIGESATSALADAATAAGYAPSIHNTQPWRWVLRPGRLDLRAERSRQLAIPDPAGRQLTVSCGAALHHARMALAAKGWRVRIGVLPDPADPDLLASLEEVVPVTVTAQATGRLAVLRVRRTDRRPVTGTPVSPADLNRIALAAEGEGARLHVLRRDQLIALAVAAGRAQASDVADHSARTELAYWAGGAPPAGTGPTDNVSRKRQPQSTLPHHDFGHPGLLPVSAADDRAASYAILCGTADTPDAWLRAGQALSAAWLLATELGLSVLPLSAAVEVPATWLTLRRLLTGAGEPYLVLRLGVADSGTITPVHTPRLPANQTIERVGGPW
jgi:nitroreductase